MTLQPELCGETIHLRPLREADRLALKKAGSDPEIWAQHPDSERHKPENFTRFFNEALASGGALIVEEKNTKRVIGTSRYHNLDLTGGHVEIGWTFLVKDHWGGTTNRELKALMLEHAFGMVPCVRFKIGASNYRSRRAVEKIGARLLDLDGKSKDDSVFYEIDRQSFTRSQTTGES